MSPGLPGTAAVLGEIVLLVDPGPGTPDPAALADDVYVAVHARAERADVTAADDPETDPASAAFLAPVLDALGTDTYPDPGWTLLSRGPDRVAKDGLQLVLPAGTRGGTVRGAPGSTVAVDLPCTRRRTVRGCLLRHGRCGPPGAPAARLYLNPGADRAGRTFAELCRALDREGMRYSAKVFNSAARCRRADSVVAEVPAGQVWRAADIADTVLGEDREMPAAGFALPFAPGLGVAWTDPATTGPGRPSLGQHRAQVAARGLLRAAADGVTGRIARTAALAREFRAHGIDPTAPWRPATGDAS